MDGCKGRQERATKRKDRPKFRVATAHGGGLQFSIVHAIIWELNAPSPYALLAHYIYCLPAAVFPSKLSDVIPVSTPGYPKKIPRKQNEYDY